MSHSFNCMFIHLVWSTKKRQPWIEESIEQRVYQYIDGIVKNENSKLLAINGMPDHVHLLIKPNPLITIPELVRKIKSGSSKFIRQINPEMQPFTWQKGYSNFSISVSMLDTVKNYIHKQKEHHQKGHFDEEYVGLLKKHNIEYDEQHIFE